MLKKFSPALVAVSLVSAGTGCTDELLDKKFEGDALAVIQGTLLATPGAAVPERISIGLSWSVMDPTGECLGHCDDPFLTCNGSLQTAPLTYRLIHHYQATQDIEVEAQFPLRFRLPITQLPPDQALLDLEPRGGTGKIAQAFVFAYVDGNGNGTYDAGAPGNIPDRLLSVSAASGKALNFEVQYADSPGAPYPLGFSILKSVFQGADENNRIDREVLAVDANIELVLSAEEADVAQLYNCGETEYRFEPVSRAGETIECSDDGRQYGFVQSETTEAESSVTCVRVSRGNAACIEPNAPAPANWPCELR